MKPRKSADPDNLPLPMAADSAADVDAQPARFRRALLAWFDAHQRDLPWRRTRDPYGIWLSEVMLQQTTVRTVEPRWLRFLARFPTVSALAAAPLDDVLHEWTGLGYYARARNLHRAANVVARDFGGQLPREYELLLALPGMGVYTAAAVASIAFGVAVPVVDANVERVAARVMALPENARTPAAKRSMRAWAERQIDPRRPGDFNQAIMELGALICSPRRPSCESCPVAAHCRARALGEPELYPILPAKAPLEAVREAAVVIRRGSTLLVLQRPPSGSFAGMWELPRGEARTGESIADAAERIVRETVGLAATIATRSLRLQHTVMRRRIELTVFEAREWKGKVEPREHVQSLWVTPTEWMEMPKSTTQAQIALYLETGQLPGRKSARKSADQNGADESADLFQPSGE